MKLQLRFLFSAVFVFHFCLLQAKGKCGCDSFPEILGRVTCEPIKFSNGAKIFWKINCNGSILFFQKGKIKRTIYSLDKNLVEYTGKLGYSFFDEYKGCIRVHDRAWSGTGSPYLDVLINKNNGKVIADLGYTIYESESKKYPPFLLNLKNTNTLIITNLNNNKIYKFPLPKGRLDRSLEHPGEHLPTEAGLFDYDEITFKNGILKVVYDYYDTHSKKWKKANYPINVAKCLSRKN